MFLFAQRMRGILHLLALSNALTKHLNLNADVMTVLPGQIRHLWRFALAVWPVAALARLETQIQITKFGELLPASEELQSHGAGRQRGRVKARIIFRDTIDFGIFQSLGDRLHDRVLAYSGSVSLQLFCEILRKLSRQLGKAPLPSASPSNPWHLAQAIAPLGVPCATICAPSSGRSARAGRAAE